MTEQLLQLLQLIFSAVDLFRSLWTVSTRRSRHRRKHVRLVQWKIGKVQLTRLEMSDDSRT